MTTPSHVLIVDDEPDIRELLTLTLEPMGIHCTTAADLGQARGQLKQQAFDLCLTDMKLPDGDGLELVAHVQRHFPQLPVAVITAYGSMETAIQALKSGAFDFISKPVDLETLRNLIANALKLGAAPSKSSVTLIGAAPVMDRLRATIAKLARSQAPVYISGESGTGKELVARLIHDQGPRASQPFIPINCGAIPHDLMESEFFGHQKGSFTGAVADKLGLFQSAQGGTLFLDEVAELPLHMQVKLLRAIQEKSVRPIGGRQELDVDVRVLSATHRDLSSQVSDGKFRQDLYYRLNVIQLDVPPLRERRGDIRPLTESILGHLAREHGIDVPVLSPSALQALESYPFPGNVRELENILERAMTLREGHTIDHGDLQLPQVGPHEANHPRNNERNDESLTAYLDHLEKEKILAALEQTRWNKTAAARLLGISFRALRYRLEKLGLD